MSEQPFKNEDVLWQWTPPTPVEDTHYPLRIATDYVLVRKTGQGFTRDMMLMAKIGQSWVLAGTSFYVVAELLRQLAAERQRCREEEVGPLMKALYDLRAWAINEVGNNDVPQEAVDAIVAINAVEKIQKELP